MITVIEGLAHGWFIWVVLGLMWAGIMVLWFEVKTAEPPIHTIFVVKSDQVVLLTIFEEALVFCPRIHAKVKLISDDTAEVRIYDSPDADKLVNSVQALASARGIRTVDV